MTAAVPVKAAAKKAPAKPKAAAKKAPAKKAAPKAKAPKHAVVRFTIDDQPMPDSQNSISSVAWQATKGCGTGDARLTTGELRALLTSNGVEDVHTSWSYTLANGTKVGAKREAA